MYLIKYLIIFFSKEEEMKEMASVRGEGEGG